MLKQLVHGNLRKTLLFFLTEAVSAGCGIALFPASLKHLFEGDKGKETISLAQNQESNYCSAVRNLPN